MHAQQSSPCFILHKNNKTWVTQASQIHLVNYVSHNRQCEATTVLWGWYICREAPLQVSWGYYWLIRPLVNLRHQAQLHWYAALFPPDICIPPWETFIASSTKSCMVGHGKIMGVILNPDFCNLYQCRPAVYRVALIQSRGSSLVVTHHTADVRVTSDRPVTRGLVPV